MSTAAVSSNLVNFQSPGYFHQRRADLSQLSQDLKSGNLTAAQQDFNSIQTLAQGGPFASSGNAFAVSARQQDFASIGTALQAGDAAGAQQALTQLESTFQHQSVTLDPVPTAAGGATSSGSTSTASPASGSPIVLNLGNIGSGEQITIGISNSSSGGEQLNISVANSQNQSPEQISLNLQNSNQQVVLNLFNSSTTSSDSNSGVSVVA